MNWKVEHRPQVRRLGKIRLTQPDTLTDCFGFRSVYAFPEDMVEYIIANNSTRGLHGCELYSDTLFLDFDDVPEAADAFEDYLITSNTLYEKYDSGNRSVHYHIPLAEPMIGPNVPQMQKLWVKKHAPEADISFYQPAGMYRLPGTYHPKNPGHCKRMLTSKTDGKRLFIEEMPEFKHIPMPMASVDDDAGEYYTILARLVTSEGSEGGRNSHIWKITKTCANLGFDAQRALAEASFWNQQKCSPSLPAEEIIQVVRGVYGHQMA